MRAAYRWRPAIKPARAIPRNEEDDPETYILGPGSIRDLGLIEATAALAARVNGGPIRLQNGYPGARGWGWRHITSNADRLKQITKRGFATPLAFACAVSANWTLLFEGPSADPDRVTVVWPEKGFELGLALQWRESFWSITTMLPFRSVGRAKLYVRE